jgi:multidrug efflux system outer membrane protein
MVSELTTAWVTLAADNSNLALAKSTMESAANSLNIVKRQQQVGVAAATDVSSAMAFTSRRAPAWRAIKRW